MHVFVQPPVDVGGGGDGEGGAVVGGGLAVVVPRDPQSTQSVPDAQYEYSEPEPPSSQMPLEA